MRKFIFPIALGMLILSALACDGTTTPTSPSTGPVQPLEPPVGLTLANNSGVTACTVYIAPTTDDTWGDDWLGSETLASGSSRTFTVDPGSYDLLARDCDNNILDNRGASPLATVTCGRCRPCSGWK